MPELNMWHLISDQMRILPYLFNGCVQVYILDLHLIKEPVHKTV